MKNLIITLDEKTTQKYFELIGGKTEAEVDCKFHSHPSTHFTLMFPPVSQTCFQSFHFYVSTFGQLFEMNLKNMLANASRLI